MGDSHVEASVNPDLLPHAVNIAKSAENYFYTYYKLRYFLAKNPQVSSVVLGFSWHNFPRKYQESFLFGDTKSAISAVNLYFPLLDQQGKDLIRSFDSSYLIPWARNTLGTPFQLYNEHYLLRELAGLPISRNDINFFGGFNKINTSNIDDKNIKIKIDKYFSELSINNLDSDFSLHMTDYLNKIITLCSQHNIKVVLLNTPVHKLYRDNIPYVAVNYFSLLQDRLKSKYNNLEYLDYSNYQLPADFYYDGDHLNSKGADVFTSYLASKLASVQ